MLRCQELSHERSSRSRFSEGLSYRFRLSPQIRIEAWKERRLISWWFPSYDAWRLREPRWEIMNRPDAPLQQNCTQFPKQQSYLNPISRRKSIKSSDFTNVSTAFRTRVGHWRFGSGSGFPTYRKCHGAVDSSNDRRTWIMTWVPVPAPEKKGP